VTVVRRVLAVAFGIGLVVLVVHVSGVVSDGPCRLRSVDEDEFVAANRELLDALPVYPGASRTGSDSNGWYAGDACFGFAENSGPIDRYETTDRFTLPVEGASIVSAPWKSPDEFGNRWVRTQVPAVLVWYHGELHRRGWRTSHWSGHEIWFEKGEALLNVGADIGVNDPYQRPATHWIGVVHDLD
jgi:hypothetical protein